MKIIESRNNNHIKDLCKLKDKIYRDEAKLYLIEGYNLIEMAKDDLVEILTTNKENIPSYLKDKEITICSESVINKLSQTKTPQPIIGVCKYKETTLKIGKRICILDNLQDPGNVGTIIRSCLAFNLDTIILSKGSVDIYNDKIIRASQGAIFKINIVQDDLLKVINKLKDENIKIIGTSLKNAIYLNKLEKSDNFALVLGNEGNGVSEEILKLTDYNVIIPISDKIDSLNVAVAGAIIMNYLVN